MAANFFNFRNGISLSNLSGDPATVANGDIWYSTSAGAFRFRAAGVTSSFLTTTGLTASKAVVTDGSSNLLSSTTTATEVGYLSGVTSAIQTQFTGKLSLTGGTMTGAFIAASGTLAAPGIAFATDTGTGFYKSNPGEILVSSSGTNTFGFLTSQFRTFFSGSNSVPAVAVGSNNSGIYAGSGIGISSTGTSIALFQENTGVHPQVQAGVVNAAVGFPQFTFQGDTDTGMYWSASDSLSLTTGGTARLSISSTGVVSVPTVVAATSTTTGSLTVAGGLGVAGAAYAASFNGVFNSAGRNGAVRTATATTTILASDDTVLLDMTSGAFTSTLPAASAGKQVLFFMKIDSGGNAATIAAAGTDTINGSASVTLGAQYDTMEIWSDGSGKWIAIRSVIANSANAIVRRDSNFGIQASGGNFAGTTASTSKTTGAIITAGGIGVSKDVTAAGFLFAGSTSGFITHRAAATTTSYSLNWPAAQGGASTLLLNDGSGNFSWNSSTGTGNVVFSASPTFTGTALAAALAASSTITATTFIATTTGTLFNSTGSNPGAANNIVVNNASSTGMSGTAYQVGGGANGQAKVLYSPGASFLVGPTDNDTSTPVQLVTNNGAVGFQLAATGSLRLGQTSTTNTHALNTSVGTNGAGVLTLTNAPTGRTGNPAGYITITINGTLAYLPYWT